MASGTMVRRVLLQIGGDSVEAEEKLDLIKAKAEELRDLHPELTPRIDTAEAQAKMRVLRDELKITEDAAAEPLEIRVASAEAQAKLDLIKANAEELRALNPTLIPRIDDAEASAKLAVLRGEITETEASSEGLGKAWEVTKYALLGVGAALGYGVYKAAGFQAEMERVHTQAGVSTTMMKTLSGGVLQLAGQVGQGPDSLAEAMYHVASNFAGLHATAPQMLDAVKVAAEGAQVGGSDLVDTTNALGAVIAAKIPGVHSYTQAMGALNETVGQGDMTMQNLAEAMGTGFLANVKLYGTTLNDSAAILATFGDNLIRGAHAGTQLRMSVQAIAVQASTATPYLKELGLQTGELGKYQSLHGTVATVQLFVDKLKAAKIPMDEWGNVVTQVFSKKAGSGIGILVDQLDSRLLPKFDAITKSANHFGKAWQATQGTAQVQLKRLEDGSEALAISLGIKLLPAATRVMHWLSDFVNDLEKGNGKALAIAGTIGTVLGLIALKKLEDGLKGAVEGVEGFGKGVWKAQKFLIGFGKEGDGLLVKIGKLGWSAAQTAGSWISSGAKMVASWAQTVGSLIAQGVKWAAVNTAKVAVVVAENLAAAATTAAAWVVANGVMLLGIGAVVAGIAVAVFEIVKHWRQISAEAARAWHDVVHWASVAVDAVISFVKAHWPLLVGIFLGPIAFIAAEVIKHWKAILHGAEDMYHGVVSFFESLPHRIMSAVSDFGSLLLSAGEDLIMGLIHGVENQAMGAVHAVEGVGHDIMSGIKSVLGIFSPSREFYLIGAQITAGLASGIQMTAHQATGEAARLGRDIIAAASSGEITATEAAQLQSKLGSALSRQLVTDRAGILATIKKADAYANSVTAGVLNTYGLSQAAVSTTTPAPVSSIISGLRADAQQARQFGMYIKKLAKDGLNKTYLDQLIQMGPDQGYAIAQELANAGLGDIRQINAAERSIGASASYLGQQAANAMYDTGKNAGKGFLSGLEGQEKAINDLMTRVARNMVSTLKRELGIRSPSEVMREHGRMVGAGLALGITDSTYMVDAAVRRMGRAAIPGVAAGAGGSRPGVLQLEWVGGSADQALITLLKKHIRVKGGDPGVLGR